MNSSNVSNAQHLFSDLSLKSKKVLNENWVWKYSSKTLVIQLFCCMIIVVSPRWAHGQFIVLMVLWNVLLGASSTIGISCKLRQIRYQEIARNLWFGSFSTGNYVEVHADQRSALLEHVGRIDSTNRGENSGIQKVKMKSLTVCKILSEVHFVNISVINTTPYKPKSYWVYPRVCVCEFFLSLII